MAQRVENTFSSRSAVENDGIPHRQHKGKSMAFHQPIGHVRIALGHIANQPSCEPVHGSKDVKGKDLVPTYGRPRVMSLTEPMDTAGDFQPKSMKAIRDIDVDDSPNQFACAEYANEIYVYLKKREPLFQVPTNYIKFHVQVNERMRAILIDWLVQVHDKFRLLQETLFLTVSFVDRYLAVDCKVSKGDLQLVGVTAMLLASKIEEIYTPEIRDFVYITDNAYSPSMIRALEKKMASSLNHTFGDPLCIHFLRRNSKAAKADAEKHTLAKYFMELTLPDYECVAFSPSQRAAAALCLTMKITDNSSWDETMKYYSHYDEESLKSCIKRICQLILKASNKESKLLSVTHKYSRSKFFKVASSPCLSSPYITAFAQQ